ncbi:hypothetical protein [Amycolatopsis methanolica]|uniref:TraD protein n=1 Tax=Amycolatopsis methanolica 239 TaxID=1068978 RepID=A0A076MIJ3_AMYME|nr:hypothetical protein [Amycolatopsis methanolica]AIJ20658.1 traD gene [Amycolatopsis methanolica 239]
MRTVATPAQLKTLAIRRYETTTGRRWRDLTAVQRAAWLSKTEPVLRAEEGIALDAVWRDGAWQPADQIDLFAELDTAKEVA